MARWDQPGATYDRGLLWDAPDPFPHPPQTKPKPKMKRQDYFPARIGSQIVWLRNFKIKLPLHATDLALDLADVTVGLLDVDNAIYSLETYRGALGPASISCYQFIDDALYGDDVPGNVNVDGLHRPRRCPHHRDQWLPEAPLPLHRRQDQNRHHL